MIAALSGGIVVDPRDVLEPSEWSEDDPPVGAVAVAFPPMVTVGGDEELYPVPAVSTTIEAIG